MDCLPILNRIEFHVGHLYRHLRHELEGSTSENQKQKEVYWIKEIKQVCNVKFNDHSKLSLLEVTLNNKLDNNYNKALTLSPGINPDGNRVTGGAMENTGGTSCTSFTIMTISMPAMFLLSWPGSA